MTNSQFDQPGGLDPMTPPPTDFGGLPETPSKWPKVIGVISIVFASLGLLCYGCGTLNPLFSSMAMGAIPEDQRPATPQGAQLIIQVVQTCAAFLLSLWLLIAAIGLCRHRPWARGHLIGWSLLKIILSIGGTLISIVFVPETVKQVNDQLSQGGQAPFQLTETMMMAILVFFLVWYLIWPLFLLLWFARGKIKDEVAVWAAESRAMI